MVGRIQEVEALRDAVMADRSRFVVVYGRRRVGKTFLIREALDYRFTFSHTGMESGSMSDQLEAFHSSLIDQGMESCEVPKDWIQAFGLLKRFLKASADERKVVFIDELPWMDTPRAKFVSALENFWNGWCAARKDVEAYVRERSLSMGRRELTEGYMVFGGAPYYWSILDRSLSLAQNIDRLCFTQGGELTVEFKRLYASVFKRADKHVKVVEALASRKCGMSRGEIVSAVGLKDSGKLSRILEELEESGFIRIYSPLGRVKRGSIYQLVDAFTLFYLTFMKGRSIARPGCWLDGAGSAERLSWEGIAFERVCMWHEREIRAALGIAGVSANVCAWRSARKSGGAQIDMLIDRKDGVVNVCEVKFATGEFPIGAKYALELENKLSVLKEETQTEKSLHLTMITISGVKRNEYSYLVHSQVRLNDLFQLNGEATVSG